MTKIEATVIETDLNKKWEWTETNHKSIPKLIGWLEKMGKIIIRKDRKSVWAINSNDLNIIIWRIKGTPIVHKR